MEFLAIAPAKRVSGAVDAPPSKSATNRALVLAALSSEPVEIVRPLESQDTTALTRCLAAMGASVEPRGETWVVHGPLNGRDDCETLLDVGESGTAARFVLAIAAATPGRFRLTGSARLRQRPMDELRAALVSLGASVELMGQNGCLPALIHGRCLAGGTVRVDASRSSQFLSALLLAGVAMERGLEAEASGAVASAPYVAVTVAALRAFGHAANDGPRFIVQRGARAPRRYDVPGDYSSALPLLVATGIVGGEVTVRHLTWPSQDADSRALTVLETMGVSIHGEPGAVRASRVGGLEPVRTRATDFPDAVSALAALAAFAPGESRIEGIGHLRWKESDRIAALVELLTGAGCAARAETDALSISGPIDRSVRGLRRLATANDHRIAMAAGLLSLGVAGLLVENPGCVAKSYPAFFRDLDAIAQR